MGMSDMPKSVYFIIVVELMERFSFYGIRPLLLNYFKYIGASDIEAKEYTHIFAMITYFFPLIGAAMSDSFLGKYKTILYLSMVYAVGLLGLSITSISSFQSIASVAISLCLVAIGTGGIKPCVSSFGGDMFKQDQQHLMRQFFSYFYVSINVGAVVSGFATPLLKDKNECFGGPCYFLGFIVPAGLFVVAIAIFVSGKKAYVMVPPVGEFVPWKALQLIGSAIKNTISKSPTMSVSKRVDFLDNATDFEHDFVVEVRAFLRMLVVILPLLFTWMVYEQNATAWQEQYSRMDGHWFGVPISDEMFVAVFNPLLVVIMVYLLATFVYPISEKMGLRFTPLRRLCVGAILVTMSFALSGVVEWKVEEAFNGTIDPETRRYVCGQGRCLHASYQLPQWLLLNLGESFFSPTGVEFAYQYSGKRMKSISTSVWLLLVTLGNFVVVLVEEVVEPFHLSKAENLFVFSTISAISNVVLVLLSMSFKGTPQ